MTGHNTQDSDPDNDPLPSRPISLPASPEDEQATNTVPWRDLFPLLLFRMTDGVGYLFIFPFITEMITSFHVNPARIGLYAGIAEGSLMVMEAVTAPVWAHLAKRFQRRHLMIFSLLVSTLPVTLIGFSTKVWHVVLARAIMGSSSIAVLNRTLAVEMSNPVNRSSIFAIFAPTFALGGMIGTFLGGELAHPFGRLPAWLGGGSHLLQAWPYLLPCLTVVGLEVFTIFIGILYLKEPVTTARAVGADEENNSPNPTPTDSSFWDVMKVPSFLLASMIFAAFQLVIFSFDAIYAVYAYTKAPDGGLELPVDTIGVVMSGSNLSYIVLTPLVLPLITRYLGDDKALRFVFFVWPILAILLPITQRFAATARSAMSVLIVIQQIIKTIGYFARPLCDMLILGAFDQHPHLLVQGSAVSMITGAGARALGPAVSGWLYSISTQFKGGSPGRQIYWVVFLCFTLVPLTLSGRIAAKQKAPGDGYEPLPAAETDLDASDEVHTEE